MGDNERRTYHFETADQWDLCLFTRAGYDPRDKVRPLMPLSRVPERSESTGARSLVVTHGGEILWVDDAGNIFRVPGGENGGARAPDALVRASKVAATRDGIWTLREDSPDRIELFEADTFTRLLELKLPGIRLIDLASDGRKTIFALTEENGKWKAVSFDAAGRNTREITFEELSGPVEAFTYLRNSRQFVVRTAGTQPKLIWFRTAGSSTGKTTGKHIDCEHFTVIAKRGVSRTIASLRPCFIGTILAADSKDRVFLAGHDGRDFGEAEYVLTFDTDGNLLEEIPIDAADANITGLSGARGGLLATGRRGLLTFASSEVMPEGPSSNRASLITPLLSSPDRADGRRWLRIEAAASLPEGTTLEISYASADSYEDRDRILRIANDPSITASRRIDKLFGERGLWKGRTVFRGSGPGSQGPKDFSAKLFNEKGRYLWVSISLTAAPGASVPSLSKLDVFYPGKTLMEYLPAIYQKEEARPDSFLRSLVGVLETTTHDLDERIASLGSLINPERAPGPWLDFVARWVGLPWDDDLGPDQKRCLLSNAEKIIESRGTRRGLEAFLECVVPGKRRRFRISDPTADRGFAILGGGKCAGSTLPAILGGHASWATELGIDSVLGRMRLKCEGRDDDGLEGLAGKIRVDVAAKAEERKAWGPWLPALIDEMVPLTARVELRWVPEALFESGKMDGTMVLRGAPVARLDTDAITGLALLPDTRISLSDKGPIIGRRLK